MVVEKFHPLFNFEGGCLFQPQITSKKSPKVIESVSRNFYNQYGMQFVEIHHVNNIIKLKGLFDRGNLRNYWFEGGYRLYYLMTGVE